MLAEELESGSRPVSDALIAVMNPPIFAGFEAPIKGGTVEKTFTEGSANFAVPGRWWPDYTMSRNPQTQFCIDL